MLNALNLLLIISEDAHFSMVHVQNVAGLRSTSDSPIRLTFVDSFPGKLPIAFLLTRTAMMIEEESPETSFQPISPIGICRNLPTFRPIRWTCMHAIAVSEPGKRCIAYCRTV